MGASMLQVRDAAQQAPGRTVPAPVHDDRAGRRARLVCARCGTSITSAEERVERGGSHEHVKVNPHGLAFRIGCFRSAGNLHVLGPPERHWSWFAGYAWQVCCCVGCTAHLGWLFTSGAGRFHGLLLDELIEAQDDEGPAGRA